MPSRIGFVMDCCAIALIQIIREIEPSWRKSITSQQERHLAAVLSRMIHQVKENLPACIDIHLATIIHIAFRRVEIALSQCCKVGLRCTIKLMPAFDKYGDVRFLRGSERDSLNLCSKTL